MDIISRKKLLGYLLTCGQDTARLTYYAKFECHIIYLQLCTYQSEYYPYYKQKLSHLSISLVLRRSSSLSGYLIIWQWWQLDRRLEL